jgi:hypothetical protein
MTSKARQWLLVLVAIGLLVGLWRQVFVMTGVLWWDAPHDKTAVARPAPPHIPQPDTAWVDLGAYLHTHSVWQP